MTSKRTRFVTVALSTLLLVTVGYGHQHWQAAEGTAQGQLPTEDEKTAILAAMNEERDTAETLIQQDTGLTVSLQHLTWSTDLANTAKDRIERTLDTYGAATAHLPGNVAENLVPYGIRNNRPGSVAYAAADLVKGWSGIQNSCTDAEWAAGIPYQCGEKAANSFVAIDTSAGAYRRECDRSRVATCGHYGNIIERGFRSVGCAKAEMPSRTDPDNITEGGWSCVFE